MTKISVETYIAKFLHSQVFFEEFVFAKNKFKTLSGAELELADAVVLLDDVILIMQIKERSSVHAGDEDAELTWFDRKVLGTAVRQIKNSLEYLNANASIPLANERGKVVDLGFSNQHEIIKLIIYQPAETLPEIKRLTKFHRSETGGFIHVISADDYRNLTSLFRIPEDVIRYLRFREMTLTKFADDCSSLPEASLAGAYVGDTDDVAPRFNSFVKLHRLVPDQQSWDISSYLRTLREHTSDPNFDDDYYQILQEFVRLPRSAWRLFKERLLLCINHAEEDKFALPYRFACPDRDVGFMLFAPDSSFTQRCDWETQKQAGLITFTELQKFDQKLRKCIGVQVTKDGQIFDIQWCMISGEWEDNPELRAKLDSDSPFRPVKPKLQYNYFTRD
jgi:hypothetical protein